MGGEKPVLRIVAKSKNSDNFKSIAAFWDNSGRLGGKLDNEVSHIVFSDGTEISNENAWINVYDDREKKPSSGGFGKKPSAAKTLPATFVEQSGDDIPF